MISQSGSASLGHSSPRRKLTRVAYQRQASRSYKRQQQGRRKRCRHLSHTDANLFKKLKLKSKKTDTLVAIQKKTCRANAALWRYTSQGGETCACCMGTSRSLLSRSCPYSERAADASTPVQYSAGGLQAGRKPACLLAPQK